MKAVYIEAHGGPEVLTYGDRPEPEIKPPQNQRRWKVPAQSPAALPSIQV